MQTMKDSLQLRNFKQTGYNNQHVASKAILGNSCNYRGKAINVSP